MNFSSDLSFSLFLWGLKDITFRSVADAVVTRHFGFQFQWIDGRRLIYEFTIIPKNRLQEERHTASYITLESIVVRSFIGHRQLWEGNWRGLQSAFGAFSSAFMEISFIERVRAQYEF